MKTVIASNKTVYVHCKVIIVIQAKPTLQAGRGRSVVATVCYLIEEFKLSTDEAVALVKKERPQINMGYAQLQSCKDYEARYSIRAGQDGTEDISVNVKETTEDKVVIEEVTPEGTLEMEFVERKETTTSFEIHNAVTNEIKDEEVKDEESEAKVSA